MTELTLIKDNDGIIDIQMNRPPVNALNYELVDALHQAIDLNTSNGAKGLILSGAEGIYSCLLYTSPSPRDKRQSRMPSSA